MKIAQVRQFALALAEATEAPHHHFSSFRVRGKIFVTIPPGEDFIHVFVGEQVRETALALYPDCVEKLLWGGKVLGLRVQLQTARAKVVKDLLREAWTSKAPTGLKTLSGG